MPVLTRGDPHLPHPRDIAVRSGLVTGAEINMLQLRPIGSHAVRTFANSLSP